MQDFTGVPAIVDLAAMRDAMEALGGDPRQINPLVPVELVIDHSIQVDVFGEPRAFQRNAELEFERNRERYAFLRWGQEAFDNFSVVPPNTGICHQVNLEYLANVVHARDGRAFPDTLVGTDSHTTMVNGLGVLGWGVGGIEAEAAMLGQPVSMLIPRGGRLPADRRAAGGRDGHRPRPDRHADAARSAAWWASSSSSTARGWRTCRWPTARRSATCRPSTARRAASSRSTPRRCATCAFTGRPAEQVELVEAYCRAQGLFHEPGAPEPVFSDTLELDLATVEPSLAGPRRPQDRVALSDAASDFREELRTFVSGEAYQGWDTSAGADLPGERPAVEQGRGRLAEADARAPRRRRAGGRAHERRRPRPRRGRDRRDHELHEHVEPVGHARRRPAGPQGRRGGPDAAAVGEDEPRARARRSSPSTWSARG